MTKNCDVFESYLRPKTMVNSISFKPNRAEFYYKCGTTDHFDSVLFGLKLVQMTIIVQ